MLKEFKSFIMRGNVMDLAVGVIIGAAFGKIVSSLVSDIIMPLISLLTGGINFTGLSVRIAGTDAEPILLAYGKFIQATIDFLIIAAVIFLMIRLLAKVQKPSTAAATAKPCPRCFSSINIEATRCPHCTSDIAA
jgi:large conductance mechanosensitive channel